MFDTTAAICMYLLFYKIVAISVSSVQTQNLFTTEFLFLSPWINILRSDLIMHMVFHGFYLIIYFVRTNVFNQILLQFYFPLTDTKIITTVFARLNEAISLPVSSIHFILYAHVHLCNRIDLTLYKVFFYRKWYVY